VARYIFYLIIACVIMLCFVLLKRLPVNFTGTSPSTSEEIVENPFEWEEYTSPKGDFSVALPHSPLHSSQQLPIPNSASTLDYHLYTAENKNKATYMISTVTYPFTTNLSNPGSILAAIKDQMLNSRSDYVLESNIPTDFKGYPGLDFTISNEDNLLISRAILIRRTLYVLTLVDTKDEHVAEEFQYFIGSFVPIGKATFPSE
jgi:hypothetical protein